MRQKHILAITYLFFNLITCLCIQLHGVRQQIHSVQLPRNGWFAALHAEDKNVGPRNFYRFQNFKIAPLLFFPVDAGYLIEHKRFVRMGYWQSSISLLYILAVQVKKDVMQLGIPFVNGNAYNKKFSPESYKITFEFKKQWWKSGWAFFLLSGIFMFTYFTLKKRRAALRNRKYQNILATERIWNLKHAISILDNSKKSVEQRLRVQSHLLASISHDIKTPLSFVSAVAKEVKVLTQTGQYDKVLEMTEVIAFTGEEIIKLIGNLTSFIKNSMNGKEIELFHVNLKEVVLQKTKVFDHVISLQTGHLTINIPPNISVRTNPELLGVMIHNLVDNAIKVKNGNHINITTVTIAGKIHLIVSDHGPGMPAHFIDWLSSNDSKQITISRGPSTTIGLGLVLVKEISCMLGIDVMIENRPGASICLKFQQ
ncbi:sensor histidine kinase KdpD [Dyadobacter sp. CY356]|uniref:sensor histidine kinase n=1 Tax=Dyadobacter sp. CY356 TaxID=2906442 RepID=UPI001F24BCC9|nr:HAMP domain-containing sensor histidine kinase [Dyadobacter sp. CY356]MCF0055085.1 HAMP domain-containing histidine kinase [Dyadobacter sp. CY356]